MLNELFETFPEYVAFQILTYRSHPDAELIKEFWRIHYLWKRLHNIGMSRIIQDIDRLVAEMEDDEIDVGLSFGGFSNYYMDHHSPNADNNIYIH